jgi:hypothetical protein
MLAQAQNEGWVWVKFSQWSAVAAAMNQRKTEIPGRTMPTRCHRSAVATR